MKTLRIRARADVADEKFERAMGTVGTLDDPAASAEADEILAGPKAKILMGLWIHKGGF